LRDFEVKTELDQNYRDAELKLNLTLTNARPTDADLHIISELFDPKGDRIIARSSKAFVNAHSEAKIVLSNPVQNPHKWTAETPNLYKLIFTVKDEGGKTLEV